MQQIELYRYVEEDGSITVTPIKRSDTDTVHKIRLVADEEKALTDGENIASVVDVSIGKVEKWTEIDAPIESEGELDG